MTAIDQSAGPVRSSLPYDARQIANFILDLAQARGDDVTNLRLQKLLYFSFGFCTVQQQEPLFHNPIEAWKYGPVVRVVWSEFKGAGKEPIKTRASYFDFANGRSALAHPRLDLETAELVSSVYDDLRHLAPWTLSDLTHERGTSWDEVWNAPQGSVHLDGRISADRIRREFELRLSSAIRA